MKAKAKDFRNMVGDPYLYNDCCGGAVALGADGSVEEVERDLGAKAKRLAFGIVILVGVVVSATWIYNKYIK